MLFDTHAHLDYPEFAADFEEVLARAESAGVSRMLTIATGLQSSLRAVELAEKYPMISAVIGIHPLHAHEEPESSINEIEKLASHPKVVAIGEIGLDFHERESTQTTEPALMALGAQTNESIEDTIRRQSIRSRQSEVFSALLDVAVRTGKNVVIHQRDSWEETLSILKPFTGKLRGVFHCFGGSIDQAREILSCGHIVSFTGIVTFKNAVMVRETARALHPGQFFLETDCPYLAPAPYRGKRCEPAHTRIIAEELAKERGESVEQLCSHTTEAAKAFFKL